MNFLIHPLDFVDLKSLIIFCIAKWELSWNWNDHRNSLWTFLFACGILSAMKPKLFTSSVILILKMGRCAGPTRCSRSMASDGRKRIPIHVIAKLLFVSALILCRYKIPKPFCSRTMIQNVLAQYLQFHRFFTFVLWISRWNQKGFCIGTWVCQWYL